MTNATLSRVAHVTIRVSGDPENGTQDMVYYKSRVIGEKISLPILQNTLDVVLSDISDSMVADYKEGKLK